MGGREERERFEETAKVQQVEVRAVAMNEKKNAIKKNCSRAHSIG